jgi:deoxycytidylate deaminase
MTDIMKLLKVAIATSNKSDCKHRVACILVDDRGRIVATGYNHHSVTSKRLNQHTIHAESDALSKVKKDAGNLTAFLYRHNNNPIHPCSCCMVLLNAYGIKDVISMHTLIL